MTRTRIMLGAVAAFALAGAAAAQDSMPSPAMAPTDRSGPVEMTAPPSASAMPDAATMPAPAAPSASAMGADASVTASSAAVPVAGSVTVSTVTNGPVPDTAENRAKYGSPMSRAGKMTRAAGN